MAIMLGAFFAAYAWFSVSMLGLYDYGQTLEFARKYNMEHYVRRDISYLGIAFQIAVAAVVGGFIGGLIGLII